LKESERHWNETIEPLLQKFKQRRIADWKKTVEPALDRMKK